MTDTYVRGQLCNAVVAITCINGQPVNHTGTVSGYCEVLGRLVEGGQPVGYIVQGYNRRDGRRFVGTVSLEVVTLLPPGDTHEHIG